MLIFELGIVIVFIYDNNFKVLNFCFFIYVYKLLGKFLIFIVFNVFVNKLRSSVVFFLKIFLVLICFCN